MVAIVASMAVAGLAVVAVASATTSTPSPKSTSGACATLSDNPEALEEMQALRTEHHADMEALLTKYGIDAGTCSGGGMMRGQGGGMMRGGSGGGMGGDCGVEQSN